jgi:phenazine biosynthesis protein phzE
VTGHDILATVLGPEPPAFALLHRPGIDPGSIDVLVGEVSEVPALADIPLADASGESRHEALVLVPYRSLAERGFECVDDGEPLTVLRVTAQAVLPIADVRARIPDTPISLRGGHFDIEDDAYADLVRQVVREEIGRGEGANFVLSRTFCAEIPDYSPERALVFFRRLLERETGAHWTFLVHAGGRTLLGASPERHLTLDDDVLTMNPISGTYRYPPTGPALAGVLDFLADRKETDELYMVVDEELKMMARVCEEGGRVTGPYLKEMAHLAHTEYFIEGRTTWDVRDLLRETMFAPTVVGSPLESACRIIRRYEPTGRRYYSGVAALIGHDEQGRRSLDSAILIRTADIDREGHVQVRVGATIVRHSDPDSEAAETRAKAAGMLSALGAATRTRFADLPEVREALERRDSSIAPFWFGRETGPAAPEPKLQGRSVLIIDAEDNFTSMIALQLRASGMNVTVRRFDDAYRVDEHDLVVMGPGPGDPLGTEPKIGRLRSILQQLLDERRPFLAVCLSHQILSTLLGLPLVRRESPNQGLQKKIDLFGRSEHVGFYNTFAAVSSEDRVRSVDVDGNIEVCRDASSGEVHALRGPRFRSFQFHAESVLTEDGVRILHDALADLARDDRAQGALMS